MLSLIYIFFNSKFKEGRHIVCGRNIVVEKQGKRIAAFCIESNVRNNDEI